MDLYSPCIGKAANCCFVVLDIQIVEMLVYILISQWWFFVTKQHLGYIVLILYIQIVEMASRP